VARTRKNKIDDGLGEDWPGPVLKRMLQIGADVQSGRADAETVAAWEGMRESMLSCIDALDKALEPYPVEEHEEMTRQWMQEVMAKMDWSAIIPTVH
jgi:hypothetical protein